MYHMIIVAYIPLSVAGRFAQDVFVNWGHLRTSHNNPHLQTHSEAFHDQAVRGAYKSFFS